MKYFVTNKWNEHKTEASSMWIFTSMRIYFRICILYFCKWNINLNRTPDSTGKPSMYAWHIWLEPVKYTIFPLQLCSFQILCAPLCASFQQLWHNEKSNIYLITLVMWSWQRRVGLLFCCHFWMLFSVVCWRGQARVWGQLPLCPILPSCPNFCCLSLWNSPLTWEQRIGSSAQQVPAPWKPLFSPQNIPFCSFEDLSLCKASITRPRVQPWQSRFSALSLID